MSIHQIILLSLIIFASCEVDLEHSVSMEYYYSLRDNDKNNMTFLLDTSNSQTVYFNDASKPYTHLLPLDTDEFTASIEINGLYLKEFTFDISRDKTGIPHNDQCQGVIGFGIEDGENAIMDTLKDNKIIKRKVLYFSTLPYPKIQFHVDIPRTQNLSFTECALSDRSNVDDDYSEMWMCDMSHIFLPNKTNTVADFAFNNTIEVKTKAGFDAKSYYITVPIKYLPMIKNFYNDNTNVNCVNSFMDNLTYLSCEMTPETLSSMNPFMFLLDGMMYEIKADKLFMQMELNKYTSLIRFVDNDDDDKNIWIFGYPLFASYMIEFDFDREVVGFNGTFTPVNVTKEWSEWYKKNEVCVFGSLMENRNVMIIGIVCLSVILVVIALFVVRSFMIKRKEHGPLIEEAK